MGAKTSKINENIPKTVTNQMSTKLSFITYNIWFDQLQFQQRNQHMLKIIQQKNPDFVCLQEVTPAFVADILLKDHWITKNYTLSDSTGSTVDPYGVMLLSKYPHQKLTVVDLPTRMDRSLLLGEYVINSVPVAVGTVHLESLSNALRREKQIEIIAKSMSGFLHWFLMGDFNFDSERNYVLGMGALENDILSRHMPNAIDTWAALNPDKSSGKTFDSDINLMLTDEERMRYDRIMMQSIPPAPDSQSAEISSENPPPENSKKWVPTKIELIGTEPIVDKELWPSDHFGIYLECELV